MSKIKVFCAVPTGGTVVDAQTYFWRETEKRFGDKIEFIWPKDCVRRIFHDYARNGLVEDFIKSDAEILFFLDSDVVPPYDLMKMVLEHDKWKLAGAPYPIFMKPGGMERQQVMFTAYNGKKGQGLGAADIPPEGTDFIDGLATGCMFIKREVFDKLKKPYFEFKYNEESRTIVSGEDLGFCQKVNALGYKFYVDYSMVCKHYKTVCLLDVCNYAQEYAKRSIEQYHNLIKPQVDQLVDRLRKKDLERKGQGIARPAPKLVSVTGASLSKLK